MDFIVGLPNSYGYTTIMVVVDRLTKYAHFVAMKSDFNSKSVAEAFMTYVVKLHDVPRTIVSDRDKVFTSSFWKNLFQLQGTILAMSSAYHPQSDGQSKALNKCLEMYLRCFTFDNPKAWFKALTWAEFWYNTTYHTSIGMTPFKAVYGRDPPSILRYEPQNADPQYVREQLQDRDEILTQLKQKLTRAQQAMKHQADKKRSELKLQVGDKVLVKLQPYRQHSVTLRKNQKLGMRFFGPFPVIAKIGEVAYTLKLPEESRIHPVFHVSQLKLFHGNEQKPYLPLPLTEAGNSPIIQPIEVLQARTLVQGTSKLPQLLIQWENTPIEEATWENITDLQHNYPTFNLEDKVVFKGDGDE